MKLSCLLPASPLSVAILTLLSPNPARGGDSFWSSFTGGNWETAGNWNSGAVPGATSGIANADVATFSTTPTSASTITVDANRNVGGITFSNTSTKGYKLSGATLLLSNNGVIQTAAGNGLHTDEIVSEIAIQGDRGSGSFMAFSTDPNSILRISGGITGMSLYGNVTSLLLGGSNTGGNAFYGTISNGAAGGEMRLIKSGVGTWQIGGSNDYTGATYVEKGILTLLTNNGLGSAEGGTTVSAGATLEVFLSATSTFAEDLILNGFGTTDENGALLADSNNTITASGTVTLAGDTLITSLAGMLRLTNATGISGSGKNLTVGGASNTDIESPITTGSGTLTKTGNGILTLFSDSSTYTGATLVSQGALNVRAGNALGDVAGGVTVASGAALQLQGGIAIGAEALTIGGAGYGGATGALRNVSGNNTYGGLITLSESTRINSDSGTLTITNDGTIAATNKLPNILTFGGSGNLVVNSVIGIDTFDRSTKPGSVTKDGAGTLTLGGSSTYTGLTSIASGTVKLGAVGDGTNSPLGRINTGTTIADGGTLDLNGYSLSTSESLTIAGYGTGDIGALRNGSASAATYSGLITLSASSSIVAASGDMILSNTGTIGGSGFILYLEGSASGSRIDSVIGTGSGGVDKYSGEGKWTLTGTNTYTGATTIRVGTLQLGNGGETGSLSASSVITNNGNLTVNRSNTATQGSDFNSVIGGTGSFTQAGSGTTVLTGANDYSGGTTVTAGKLLVNNTTGSGTGTGTVSVLTGATLGGTGTIGGPTTIQSSGIHSPGNSPGIQTIEGTITYKTGSIFEWELNSNTDTGRGTAFDGVDVTNTNVTIEAGAIFKLVMLTGVDFGNVFWDSDQTWQVFGTGLTGTSLGTDFTIDATGADYATLHPFGGFSYDNTVGTLNWTAVPEPTSALAGLLVTAGLLRRRRTQVISQYSPPYGAEGRAS